MSLSFLRWGFLFLILSGKNVPRGTLPDNFESDLSDWSLTKLLQNKFGGYYKSVLSLYLIKKKYMTIKRKVKLIKGFVEKYKEMLINDYELAKEELGVPFELFVFTVCDSKELYDYTSKYYHQLKNEFDKIDNESVRQCYDNATFLNYIMWTKLYHNIENRLN